MSSIEKDFTLIKGIGRSFEKRLHAAGIHTYSHLALMSAEELAALFSDMPGLTAERIIEKDWIGQARRLAVEMEENGEEITPIDNETRQHYSVFTIELLLDKENIVRRTRIMHVQNQNENSWAGWDESRLIQFIMNSAELNLEKHETVPLVERKPLHTEELTHTGELRLSKLPTSAVKQGQPFKLPLFLDLTNIGLSKNTPLFYSTTVYTKKLGDGSRQFVGEIQGSLELNEQEAIYIPIGALPAGQYRIEMLVSLATSPENADQYAEMIAMTDGAIIVH